MADFTFAHREEGFDIHIEHSIRGYSNMMRDLIDYSRYFVEDGTNIVDVGCSTGKMTQALIEENQEHCKDGNYVGLEIAEGFFDDMENRGLEIKKLYPWANVDFRKQDAREYTFENCSFISSVFTLQFMPPRHRREVLQNIYKGLNHGGAFVFAEKTVCDNPRLQNMLTFSHYDYKRRHFTTEDIMDKEKTLRHMMKPNTWTEITSQLACAGFSFENIQPFWRNHNFVAAIAIK